MWRLLVMVVVGCGRIAFDLTPDAGVGVEYRGVRPVYITGYAMPALVPTGGGPPWAITPDLPLGLTIDPLTGEIAGTPTQAADAMLYTVTAGPDTTTLRLRTAHGFVVDTGADDGDAVVDDGNCATPLGRCSLRAAIQEINFIAPGNVVYIAVPTVTLTGTLPPITESIEIVGESAATTTVDANRTGHLTEFNANAIRLALAHLTYRNGIGTIAHNFFDNIELLVEHVAFIDNAEVIDMPNLSTLTVRDSSFINNTGVVLQSLAETARIERCTFAGNTQNLDGTVYFVFGDVTIESSTFSGNSGTRSALVLNNTTSVLRNNTFADNTATESFHGGAITEYSGTTSAWFNNLIVNNVGPSEQCVRGGMMMPSGGNLGFPDDTDTTPCGFDLVADARIEALADNGGPTLTHELRADSPAVGAGIDAQCPAVDQRGVPRPQGDGCDIGAYERE